MKSILYIIGSITLLYSCIGCGSTIRLDYDGGKSGSGGVGFTFPSAPAKPGPPETTYQAEVLLNFPHAQSKKVADSYEITLSRDSITYVTGPTEATAWKMAAIKLR